MNGQKEVLKKRKSWASSWPVLCLIAFLILQVGAVVGMLFTYLPDFIFSRVAPEIVESDVWNTGFIYLQFIGIWIFTYIVIACSKKSRHLLKMASSRIEGNTIKNGLLGLLCGFLINGICILVAFLHGDIQISFVRFDFLPVVFLFVCVFIQSSAEELILRGYLYHKLTERYKPITIIVITSAMFAFLHVINPNITLLSAVFIFVDGVFFVYPMLYMKNSLWFCFGMHAAWNFTQNILFGLPNSGMVFPYSVFRGDAETARDSFAYNAGFGVEGSLLATVLITAICFALFFYAYKKKIKPEYILPPADMPEGDVPAEQVTVSESEN